MEAVGGDLDPPERVGLGHGGQEGLPIGGGAEDRLAGQAPVHDVVDGARVQDAEGAGHAGSISRLPVPVNQRLDPFSSCFSFSEDGPALPGAATNVVQDIDSIAPQAAGHGDTPAAEGRGRHRRKGY